MVNQQTYRRPIQTPAAAAKLLVVLAGFLCLQSARADLLYYDDFDYTVGEQLGQSSSTPPWENAKSQLTIAAGSLEYPGLQASTGNRVNIVATSPSLDSTRTATGAWPSQTNGTLYISFLLSVQSTANIGTTGEGTSVVTVSRTANNTQLLGINLLNSGTVSLGVLKYPSSSSSVSSAFFTSGPGDNLATDGSTTFLIVTKYEWVNGAANDVVTLWVNPATLGNAEDPANKVSTSAGADGTGSAGRITFSRGPNVSIDELRIGQTWAEVTPTGSPVVTQQPHITESFLSPAGFVLRGSNGTPSVIYQVLNSTNVVLSQNLWSTIATNQFDPAGNFDCTNPILPSVTGSYYRLRVGGEMPAAPSITTPSPLDLTVLVGQNATFDVFASGTAPLAYQWYFNDAPIANATIASHTITNAQTTNAGAYHVVITNSIGSITSSVATLNVVSVPSAGVPDGYATIGNGTTGGAGGPTVTVSTFEDFEFYVNNNTGPFIVLVQGSINLGGSNVRVRDNKTIIGLGNNAALVGDLKVDGNTNVIIRNITFTNPNGAGDSDGLTLQDCLNVWVDHCTFVDCDDGSLDISHGADWITVSWCHFYYTNPSNNHRFANLVGHSDSSSAEAEDTGKLHVTYHHNWWGQLVHERMPRVRFGRVHVYSNFYNSPGNNNCIRAARDSEVLVENNYFDSVKNVWELYRTDTGLDGKVFAANNIEVNTTWSAGDDSGSIQIPGTDILSNDANGLNPLPYAYGLEAAANIPNAVTNNAGAGKGPFAP